MILFDQAGAGEPRSTVISPGPDLKGFVQHFWIQHPPVNGAGQMRWRVVPDASPYIIVVVLRGAALLENIRCDVVGARSRFADISLVNRELTLGVRLHPGTLPLLTGHPATALVNSSMTVEELFGSQGKELVETLAGQRSTRGAIRVLAEFLGQEFNGRNPPCEAEALQSRNDRAEQLAFLLGLPMRTLHARMKERVGLAPKRLLRIQRLHRTLDILRREPMPWSQISAACGFADQPHLVREFQDLLGETPTVWQERSHSADLFKTTRTTKH